MSGLRRMTSFSKPLARCGLGVALISLWWASFALAALAQTSSSSHKHVAAGPEAQALNRLLSDAQSAVDGQDYETAAQDYQDYLAKKPDDAEVHFNLGYVYTAMQRPDDAKAEYEKAIELAPDDPKMAPAYQNLGLTLLPKDPAAAVDPLRHAAELAPQDARTKWLLGMALENSGKLDQAIEQYQAAEKLNEKDFDTRMSLAHALIAAGRPADAEPELRGAIALSPDSPDAPRVHLELAECLILEKKNEPAATELATYLQSHPDDVARRLDRASLLVDLSKYDDALTELDRAANGKPETLRALQLRSHIYYQEKHWDDLIPVLQKAEALAPKDPSIPAQLGEVYLTKKDYPDAARTLIVAYDLKPGALDVLANLVEAEYQAGNYAGALQALDLLAKQKDLPTPSWYIRASCYDKLGQLAQALDAYQRFLQLNTDQNSDMYFATAARARELARELHEKKKR
ncbi:MAG: tetratricopeptide repeat protein [Candidatus Acidiferrales bacterium]